MNNFYEEHGVLPNKEQFDLCQTHFTTVLPNHPLSDLSQFKLESKIFIESGSLYGDTVQRALDCGYEKIHTIEIDKDLFNLVSGRFKTEIDLGVVVIHHGSTIDILPNILNNITEPVTFWLDAHLHNGDYGVEHNAPIIEELGIISKHKIKNHLIMVDDMRIIRSSSWGRGSLEQPVINGVLGVNKDYVITYRDGLQPRDILIAKTV